MALTIHISKAVDPKTGMIVVHEQGASFSSAELKKIRAPYRFELWASRGHSPITVVHAKGAAEAKEYLKAKYRTRGLVIRKVTVSSHRV